MRLSMRFNSYGLLFFTLFIHDVLTAHDMPKQIEQQNLTAKKESSIMISFTEQQSVNSWRITNDGVMGGRSAGSFVIKQDKGIFFGDISLDNNGGFSSVFKEIEPLVENLKTVTIDVEGDGLTYQLRMVVNLNGYRLAYKHNVETVAGQRDKLTFTLADFQASFRGRSIDNAPILKSEDIREVGFLVTRKTAGAFSLSVFSLNL